MNDEWPPPAPGVNKAFKKAHAATNDNASQAERPEIVSKKQIQDLEQQRKKTGSRLEFTPPGMRPSATGDQEREKRIEKMKKRLQESKGKARDDFNRTKER